MQITMVGFHAVGKPLVILCDALVAPIIHAIDGITASHNGAVQWKRRESNMLRTKKTTSGTPVNILTNRRRLRASTPPSLPAPDSNAEAAASKPTGVSSTRRFRNR